MTTPTTLFRYRPGDTSYSGHHMTRVILQMYGLNQTEKQEGKGAQRLKSCVLDYTDGLCKAKMEGVI